MKSFALTFLALTLSTTNGVKMTGHDATAPLAMAQEQNLVDGTESTSFAE